MSLDTPLHQLRYFLQDELYLLKTDRPAYGSGAVKAETPAAAMPATTAKAPEPAVAPRQTPVNQTPAHTFKYMGGNQKNFLILCHYPATDFMVEAHLTALTSTLGRIGFSPDDVAIVNLARQNQASWPALEAFFKPHKLLILGAAALPAQLAAAPLNQVHQTGNCRTLYSFNFDDMIGQKDNTKAFWSQVKTI